ncbi:uncharacterized protein LOC106160503, partial [Lingula anatina]|uniref:non-specific serine/threonine protein kinase n=1 Tax=Lingula anatina TaxID=7574 RepID=A0A2R2MQS5_LINAN
SPNELLKKYDYDNNDILNVKEEIPGLNTELFMSVPRLGQTFKDADSSGIPLAVFEMENLRELRLANQGINSVPQTIAKLKRLRVLELSNNPLLESVAGEVAFLPIRDNVSQGLKLDGCPSLKSPPNDIVGRGGGAVISFLKRVAGGFTVCRRTKLMFVGLGGAGKTSLLRALMSGNYKTKSLGAKEVTDGIDIKAWTVKKNDGPEVTFSTWDFAGQKVYYNTHQFFLSSRAVYLLLWTTRSGYEHAGLEFWLSSIASHAPGAPVFVIGTRADEVDKPEIPMEKLQKKFPQIAGFHFISSLTGQGIRVLEDRLVDVTLAQKYMGEQIPTVWLKLETAILTMKEKKKVSIVKWEEIAAMANEVGIYEEDDLKEAIQFLTYLGSVQYFDNEFLRKYVVINPQWIADVMACVVSIKANAIKDGRLNHSDIGVIWKAYDKEYHEWLLMLTQEFDLTFPLPDQKVNLVPCLLPGEEPKYDWPELEADSGIRETRMLYQFTYLPTGLFNRAQVRLFQFTDGKAIWKEGSFLKKNAHIALIKQTRENELSVKVQGPEPENVLLLIHEVFEGLIAEAYHGVTYTYLVQCPDCVNKQRTHDPFLFPNNLIRQASNHAGAFLQCHRFFHSISLNELEAIMPPDSKSDLDMQLENSIRKLRDMRKNNSTDILVSYCAANLTENAADPIKVVQDINNMGYTCWFDEDIGTKTLSDFIVPLKDSKLLLAMVSKEYAEDEKCKELFQYASQKLKKPYVIVTITKSFDWTKSELGMNIGLQEIFVDLSKEDVYDTKLDELKEKLKSKLEEEEKKEQDAVDVFISYCWSNSHDAVKKGTAEKDGALGWEKGDPREIRSYLESQGVRCWLDIEQAGKTGLFEDISEGLKKAKVVVACVSDEYANSPNCMMELRFAMLNLRKPLVACVVGTKSEWETSEVSILLMRGRASDTSKKNTLPPKFNFQQNLKEYPPMFLKKIQDRIAQVKEEMEKKEAVKAQPAEAADHTPAAEKRQKQEKIVSFQEEFELIQRKLMRFIEVHHAINLDIMPYPKLCVLDYVDLEGHAEAIKKSMVNLQPPVSDPDDQTGQHRKLVCKILCEYEQGWHLSGPPILLKLKDQEKFIADSAAYLARMNAVLKHSGVNLTCMGGSDEALEFVRDIELKGTDTSGFAKAFKHFREEVMKNDVHKVRGHLKRCLLPSGKIRWLCPKHADGPRITILNSDLATAKDAVLPYSKCDEETMQLIKADSKYEQTVQARQTQGQDAASALKITAQDLQAPRIAEHVTINGPASPKKLEKKKSTRKMKATQAAARVAGSYAKAKKNNSVAQESNGQAPAQAPAQAQSEGNGEKKSKACVIM